MKQNIVNYIIDFIVRFPVSELCAIHYGKIEDASNTSKVIIVSVFRDFEINNLPKTPFQEVNGTPILFGDARIEKQHGIIIVYADIIASSFFLLSRYEEILKPQCRDQHGRFLAKNSVVFQQGYGNRPLVDEYGKLLRGWLRDAGISVPDENEGFNKIFLTHDVDSPFRFEKFLQVIKQYVKNMISSNYSNSPLRKYFNEKKDEYYTFPKIICYDEVLKKALPETSVESIYFLLTAGSLFNGKYYNIFSQKIDRLISLLKNSGAKLGLHISYEAGEKLENIKYEVNRLKVKLGINTIISRHHFLQWREPEDIMYMERAGITDDFTLSYADSIGFRVGTCRSYRFINPITKELTNVTIYPLEIMDCTLDRQNYMNLDYEQALNKCKKIIDQVHKHNGDLVLLWHNDYFFGLNYQEKLYSALLDHIGSL